MVLGKNRTATATLLLGLLMMTSASCSEKDAPLLRVRIGMTMAEFIEENPNLGVDVKGQPSISIEKKHDIEYLSADSHRASTLISGVGDGAENATLVGFIPPVGSSGYGDWALETVVLYLGSGLNLQEAIDRCKRSVTILEQSGWQGSTERFFAANVDELKYESTDQLMATIGRMADRAGFDIDERRLPGTVARCAISRSDTIARSLGFVKNGQVFGNDPSAKMYVSVLGFDRDR